MRRSKSEEALQIQICNYLKYQYPKVYFTSESSGLKLTINQAKKLKSQRSPARGWSDLIILEPRSKYHGLLIELKAENIYRQDGKLFAGEHLENQNEFLARMRAKGYKALFCIGFHHAAKTIDEYLSL